MISASSAAICVLSIIVAIGAAFTIVKWLFKKDEQIEDRRRAAAELANKLSEVGLEKLPSFLVSYSVGDYSQMYFDLKEAAKLATSDPAAFMRQFEKVFVNILDAKLKTPEGRILIAAKLQDASDPSDSKVVQSAQKVATV